MPPPSKWRRRLCQEGSCKQWQRVPAAVSPSDHEVAVRVSLWLEEKPVAVAFDSQGDGASLLVRGEQPPTHTISTGYLWAQTLSEVGLSVVRRPTFL